MAIIIAGIVISTTIWVYLDARRIRIKDKKSDAGPLGWAIACLLVWIIFFPMYLLVRRNLLKSQNQLKNDENFIENTLESPIKCTIPKTHTIDETAKNIPCKICDKGQMFESVKKKHNFWPGIGCIISSFIIYCIAEENIPDAYRQSMAADYYISLHLAENPFITVLYTVSSILLLIGLIAIFVCKKEVLGWKCNYCNSFIRFRQEV